ncbi:putative uncharacterized protein DDB_G0274405 isoform X1 [Ipomoea triloba]|uniref:putative uncharacterized protein DDB_G0274405 isoform X1 n=1 Tax=Ipomoea triloba TaxID=35885 RepID=UPI00125DD22B|nr:putative uncharacterized protein DDB_G0274405 isoform X1 [Ipomoea triloba]
MFPPHNSQSRPSSQLHSNGLPASAPPPPPAQVMSNPGMQIQPPPFNPQGLITPNTHPRFPFQGPQNPNNQINNVFPQMPGQFFPQNAVNPAQFFNPNGNFGLPNGQCNLPNNNLMQTVNQLLQLQMQLQMQMQMPNFAQGIGMPGIPGVGVQNPAFTGNSQFTQQPMNGNFLNQSQQGNAPPMNAFGMVPQPHLNQSSLNHPDAAKSQGDLGQAARGDTKGNWKSSPNNNFKRNQRHDAPHTGFRKAVPQSVQNAKRNFNNHNDSLRKAHSKGGPENSPKKQNQNEKKRPLPLLYTEKEIQQWREDRRKNYPSKANIEKKSQKLAGTEDNANAAKLRRQQLKEILAKQAELGCEIAEIPSSYLSDLERPGHERENRRPFRKNEKFQYKSNKRGRFGQKNQFSKKQKFEDPSSSNIQEQNDNNSREQKLEKSGSASQSKRKPTLLQKLLGADIRRDKQHLLQVFRFMVMNSFFTECPEKPLKFPSVIVKESENQNVASEQASPPLKSPSLIVREPGNQNVAIEQASPPLKSPSLIARESGNQNVAIEQAFPIEEPFNDDNDEDKKFKELDDLLYQNVGHTEEEENQEEGEIID